MERKLTSGSLSEEVLSILGQVGIIGRRELSKVMYRMTDEPGCTERFGTGTTKQLTKALERIKAKGYIEEVDMDAPQKEAFFTLTPEGWEYIDQYGLPFEPFVRAMSPKNHKDIKSLMRHSNALYVGRSMRYLSWPSEKPSYAELVTAIDGMTSFNDVGRIGFDTVQYVRNSILPDGVCYSTQEIRNAYGNSNNSALRTNTSRRLGMIIAEDKMITLYYLNKKRSVVYKQAESKFDQVVYHDIYGSIHTRPKQIAYILSTSLIYLPSFFHGCVDGYQAKNKAISYGNYNIAADKKTVFSVDSIMRYDSVYMMPMSSEFANYREALNFYTETNYNRDATQFRHLRPDVNDRVIICRYPNLIQLRKAYKDGHKVVLAGPDNTLLIDALSRCMRNRLRAYYNIDTGEELSFTRYNEWGEPLIGDTNHVDHTARKKMNSLFESDSHIL